MPNRIDALYSEVSKSYEVGSIDDFKKYLADPKKRQLFFKEVIAPEYDVKSIDDFDEAYGFKKKSTESPSQGAQKDIFSVSGEAPKAGPSAPSVNPPSNKLQEELFQKSRLAASALVNPMKPGYTPVPEAEAQKAFYGKAKVDSGTLRGVPGETNSTVSNLNDKYKNLGFQFEEVPSKLQKSFGLGDIVVTADDGSTHIVQSVGSDEKLREEEAKLQTFLMGKSAGAEKKDVTPMEFLLMSREGVSPQEESKFKRVYTQEMVDNSIKFANDELGKTKDNLSEINSQIAQLNKEAEAISEIVATSGVTPEIEDQYNSITQKYESLKSQYSEKQKQAMSMGSLVDEGVRKAAAENARLLSDQGNIPGALYNSLLKGAKYLTGGAFAFANKALSVSNIVPSDVKIWDEKKAREEYTSTLNKVYDNLKVEDISKEYTTEGNLAWKALFSVPEFIPSLLVPGGAIARISAMTAQGTERRLEEMDANPMMKDASENEKFFMAAVPALVEAKLENYGLTQWLGTNKGIASSIALNAISKVLPSAGVKGLNRIINAEINNLVLKGAVNTAGAMITEFETGALQNISDTWFRDAYEIAKGKNIFKQSGFTDEGFKEALLQDAVLEGLGGMWMAGAVNIAQQTDAFVTGKKNTNETFRLVKEILANNTTEMSLISALKSQMVQGKLSKETAIQTINNFREAKSVARELPDGLSEDSQRAAFDLIAEKRKLTRQIEGKDPSLVDKQKTRITAIDQELKNISNAVQEQTTSEVPVQPGARVGGEVVEEGKFSKEEIAASDVEIEKRMSEIEGDNKYTDEFNSLEKEMEKRERATVFNVPLEKVNDAVDVLISKEKEMPNGFGAFVEKGDAIETKKVADRYLKAKELTDAELMKDFSDAVRGNPTTSYSDGLKMREALNEATSRGIDTEVMLSDVTKVYTDAGYDIETAKSVVSGMLKPVFKGSQEAKAAPVAAEVVEGKPQPEPQVVAEEGKVSKEEIEKRRQEELDSVDISKGGKVPLEGYEEFYKNVNERYDAELAALKNPNDQAQGEVTPGGKAIVSGVEITYPTQEQRAERETVRNSQEYVNARAIELPVTDVQTLAEDLDGDFAMVTGENPDGQPLTEEENQALNQRAQEWLTSRGYDPKPIVGKFNQAENSFFVKGMTEADAIEFAQEFNQKSVAHSGGMLYQDGSRNPRTTGDDFTFRNFEPGMNMVSVVNTTNGPKQFSVAYDFEATIQPESSNFDQALANSAQSLNVVAPGLKMIVGENIDDVQNQIVEVLAPLVGERQAVKVADDFAKGTRGQTIFVDGKPVALVFDKSTADSRTIGHEAWEAMLNDAFGNDQARFKEFADSIDSQLRAQGFGDIADALDAFASQKGYEAVKYSEYMAELGGMLVEAGFGKGPLTAQQKTLLQKIGDIINKFAELFTGKKQFLDQATPEDILGFMVTISEKVAKGEDVASFFRKGEKAKATEGVTSKSQTQAIEILDGPKFDNKLKEDVASYLNGLRDSEIPPNSSRELLMERFINNVYEEVGYYLYSKPDARSAGLTWYIEDMVEFENKIKVVLPELSNENQYKLFLTVLAFTSSGTNPNQNLLYAYNLWNNSKDPKNFEFSKTWGESKLSFIDKKGKSIASGIIVKETAKEYTVELIDSLGRPVVDKKGNKKYEKISKNSMKEGYPKSTGYTNRGEIIIGQLEKLEKIYKDLGSIDKVVKWLESPHPISELRKYNQSVPDVNGKGPGETNKEYDPKKNAEGERNGAFIFGEKIGSFYQNMIGIGETITMDLWWSRTWNRYMGTMINTVSGKKEIQEVPRSDRERNIMREAVKLVAEDLNLQVSELQAAIWYFEQELWTKSGNKSPSYSYVTAIDDLTKKLKVDEETRTKLRAAEADLTEAEKRRQNAAERAAAVVASKGGKIPGAKVESRSQKSVPPVVDEVLTDDGKGNYLFVHYSDENRDVIKPMSGSKSNFTSREEVSAISAVGGVAMYYTKAGQKESGVGNVAHTVLVPKDKVYFYGSTEKGTVSHDPEGFEEEARQRFQAYRNRGNEDRPTKYAFDANNSAAWVTKVAAENGYDMLVTNWGGPKSYRAQTTKALKPEAEYTGFKKPEPVVFEVGDEVFLNGNYSTIVAVDGNVLSYEYQNDYGTFNTGKFPLSQYTSDKITMIEKAKPSVTTRSQKVEVKTIPGYDRMMNEVEGIMDKTMNRGGSYNQASANAINYIQKSASYERADDIQREQIIRDFKKIRGEKFKVAPSVAKILGQIEDVKKITVKESTALKDQIKLEAKAAKDSAAFVKQLRMDISGRLKSMVGRGMMSARQATAIISRYDKMNILNPVMRDRFVDYMSRVFQSAEYMDKIKEASKLRASIKKNMKSAANQAEIAKLAKDFADIDPSRVEDIDDYINNATQMLNAVARKTGDPLMRSLVNAADMASYIETEIELQKEQIKNELLDKYKELVDAGVLSSDMTINEIKKVVAAIEENDNEAVAKEEKARAAVKEMMAEVSPLILQIVKTGEDPFTGEPITLTQDEKRSLVALAKMDTDNLSLSSAIQVLEYANNFVANGITSGIDGMVSLYQGDLNTGELVEAGILSKVLSKYFSKLVGKVWGEGFATLPMLNKLLWGNTRLAILVSEKAGINGISNGKAKALKMVDTDVKQYVKQFSKVKDFLASENVVERGVFAFMSRNVIGDEFQAQDEFNRRKSLIEETIQALTDVDNNTDAEIKKGEVIQKVYDKVLKDAKNINDVKKNVSQINQDAVNWWINKWSENFDRLDEVSRNVYNTQLSRDIDFTPDRFQLKEAPTATEEDFDSGFFGNFENVDTSKSGSLRKNNRIANLPKDENGVKTRIVNLDFDVNNVNAFTNAMVDVETASSVMQLKGFVTSKNFSKLFSNKDDKNLYKKRLIKYVSRVKGSSYIDQNELSKVNRIINTIASFGVAKALFSVSQPFKQFGPPMANTFVQTGRFDLNKLLYGGGMSFIDRSGYPVANRGVASQGELKSINRQLVEAEKNLAMRGLDGVAEFSNKSLEITLKYPDIFAARASWLSFYLSKLKKQGVNISGIDLNTHELNKEAADYAQAMVDSQQNISDTDMQGEIFASKQPATVFLRRAILPLMTFTLNQKTRIWSDVRTLSNDVSSKDDKREAAKSLSGALVELVAFQGIALAFKELYNVVAAAIMGEDEDEEEKKIRKMRQAQSTAQAFMKDFFLPPIPGMDIAASKGINYLLDETGLSDELPYKWYGIEDEEQKFRLYDKMNQGYLDMLGTQGIAAEKGLQLIEYYDAAIDGEFTKEYNGNKVKKALMEEDLDIARMNAVIMTAYYGGLLPSDMANIVNIMNKKIQKRAEQVDED